MLIPLQMVSDGRIVRRVLGGRRDEYALLVRRYYGAVCSVVRARLDNPADVEDVAQEAFVNAWRRLDTLNSPGRFGPWLMSIARNAAVSWSRRLKLEVLVPDASGLQKKVVEPRNEHDELKCIVRSKLLELDPEQREILLLYYYEGKKVGEIASLLDISRAAAGKRLQRAREALGDTFLRVVGEKPNTDRRRRACRAVMAAVAAAPVAWQSKAAAAGLVSVALVKSVIVGLAVATVGAGTLIGVKYAQSEPQPPAGPAPVQETANKVTLPSTSTLPAPPNAPAEQPAVDLSGPGKLTSLLLNEATDQPVPDAEVTAELINWSPLEMPPAATFKKTVRAGSTGQFVFENMPLGAYCVVAVTASLGGAADLSVDSDGVHGASHVSMYPRSSVKGRLVGEDNAPIAGAVIYPVEHILFPEDELDHGEIAALRATSSDDGSFSFPTILGGAWKFYVLRDGLPPVITQFNTLQDGMTLNLAAPGAMAGRLVDAETGAPRTGVTLQVHQGQSVNIANPSAPGESGWKKGWRVMAQATTNGDGSFHIPRLAAGKYSITLADAALLNAAPDDTYEVVAGAETAVEVRAALGASIVGRVYDRDTGKGLAAYEVLLPAYKQTSTDANGEFAFTGVEPGTYTLTVMAQTATGFIGSSLDGSPRPTVTVTHGQVLDHVDIAVRGRAGLPGEVVDRFGKPVQGARVEAFGRDTYSETVSNEAGIFNLEALLSFRDLKLLAKKDDWQSEMISAADTPKEILLTLNVPAGGAIHGKALSADGTPLVLHQVYAVLETDEPFCFAPRTWSTNDSKTDSTGEFVLENLAAGTYRVEAHQQSGDPAIALARVSLGENEVLRNVLLKPEPEGSLSISGRVMTSDGGPLLDAKVELPHGETDRIGSDGRLMIKGLAEGMYTLVVTSAGYSPAVLEDVPAGTANVSVTLWPLAVLGGAVTDAVTGKPVTSFQIRCSAPFRVSLTPDVSESHVVREVQNETGQFRINNVCALPVELEVRAAGYVPQEQHVTLKGGELNTVNFALEAGARVAGTVVDTEGNPVRGADISAEGKRLGRTDENGAFLIDTLRGNAPQLLTASHPEYAVVCAEITPQLGQETSVALVLERPGTLEVHVSVDGQPTRPCYVSLTDGCLAQSPVMIDEDVWVYKNLPAGVVEIVVTLCGDDGEITPPPGCTITAIVAAGQTTEVEATFGSRKQEDNTGPVIQLPRAGTT